jgi:lipopolysaccharide/colanic/teichoic acid biosynthesis glycosyltransferase
MRQRRWKGRRGGEKLGTNLPKRLFDLICSALGTAVLSPLFALIALAIKLESKGPIFYRGVRAGRFGEDFRIFKFRTMVENAEALGSACAPEDDHRITRVGRVLRRLKLDELPQLLNVMRGEMSLVGPRPQFPWVLEQYTPEERTILSLRPGITDFASIRFRNEGEILRGSPNPDKDYFEKIHPEKLRLSLKYLHEQSFWLDCKILLRTAWVVFFPDHSFDAVKNPSSKNSGALAGHL